MYPILLDWGSLVIPAWHTFFVLGSLLSLIMLYALDRCLGFPLGDQVLRSLFILGYLGGYFGARAYSICFEENVYPHSLHFWYQLFVFGSMTLYGGIGGAILAVLFYWLLRRFDLRSSLDVAIPSGLAGVAVGRIGCFLNGDDFGRPVPLDAGALPPWWSVNFPNLEDGIYRYPVQLWETGLIAVFLVGSIYIWPKGSLKNQRGIFGLFTLIGYAVIRFALEFFRGDERGWLVPGILSPAQGISLVVTLGGIVAIWIIVGRPSRTGVSSASNKLGSP